MKKKLLDRRGAGVELAILMMVVCFSLSVLLTSTSVLHRRKEIRATKRLQQSIYLEQIGQKFWSDVINGQVDEDWVPEEGDGFTVATEHVHIWNEEIVEPATCSAKGVMTYTCADCGETRTEDISVLSHIWGMNEEKCVDAVPCVSGAELWYLCEACGAEMSETTEAHTWDAGVETAPATCAEEGTMTYTCEVCGQTKEEVIPVNDVHNWTDEGCEDCGLERPILTYSLTVYKLEANTVKAVVKTAAGEIRAESEEAIGGTVILEITVKYDEVDRTYLVTEWTKNDRS